MHDKMRIISAKIMNEARYLEHHAPSLVAKIVRRTYKVPGHMIMVTDLAPVILLRIERPVFALTYPTDNSRIVFHLLITGQILHSPVDFKVIDTLFLLFDELFKQLRDCIISSVVAPMIVIHWNVEDK